MDKIDRVGSRTANAHFLSPREFPVHDLGGHSLQRSAYSTTNCSAYWPACEEAKDASGRGTSDYTAMLNQGKNFFVFVCHVLLYTGIQEAI